MCVHVLCVVYVHMWIVCSCTCLIRGGHPNLSHLTLFPWRKGLSLNLEPGRPSAGPNDHPVSVAPTPPSTMWGYRRTWAYPVFDIGAGDFNSAPHSYTANTLTHWTVVTQPLLFLTKIPI